nr:protein kinase [Kofleriaceae bacterium]
MSVGATVAGLTLISQFGETRAAELYIGECEDGRCLVKLVRAELCADRARVDRALDAARVVGAIDHRSIEYCIEAGWDGDRAYVLGDIVPGTNATRVIARRSLEAEQVAAIVQLVAEALAVAHGEGVVHGALEPRLVHIGFAADRVVLRDFGIAGLVDDAGARAAQEPYRAPELAPGGSSVAGDIYALGSIAREMLDATRAPSSELLELVARMTAVDASARPPATEVRDALAEMARGAENVAVAQTEVVERRRAPTEPPPGSPPRASEPAPRPSTVMAAPARIHRDAWRCDRCHTPNAQGRAFCLHCGAPAVPAHHDVQSLMAALAAHGSDDLTPPPGPPPSPPDDDDAN